MTHKNELMQATIIPLVAADQPTLDLSPSAVGLLVVVKRSLVKHSLISEAQPFVPQPLAFWRVS